MRTHNTTTRTTALALAVLLTFCTLPLSAADKSAATIGSVSSTGSVQLRGVALSNDGTLFSGDRLNVGPGSYARVVAGTGQKLEIGANSDVVVTREGDNTDLQMASGDVAFKGNGKGSTRMHIGVYDVVTSPDAAGRVTFVGSETFGVRLSSGSATVKNTKTKQSFVVQKGGERLVSLTTGANFASLSQLASSVPTVPGPALPRRQSSSGMSTGSWLTIVAAAAGSATLITYFLAREDDDERGAQIKALTDLNAILSTATATASVSAQAASTAGQAAAAISASSLSAAAKATLQSQVNAVTVSANSAASKINVLIPKIQALQQQIASQEDGPTTDQSNQLKALNAELNAARADLLNAINQLNALLASATAQGVPGLPTNPNLSVPPATNVGSASIPV
jgi:hypothetical protein